MGRKPALGAQMKQHINHETQGRSQEFATGGEAKKVSEVPQRGPGQSPGGGLGGSPQKLETIANFQLRRGEMHSCPPLGYATDGIVYHHHHHHHHHLICKQLKQIITTVQYVKDSRYNQAETAPASSYLLYNCGLLCHVPT